MGLTANAFKSDLKFDPLPTADNALFSFTFRYAVCAYAMSLKWVADSGYATVKVEKLQNDYIDMVYAAYATFFDGIITHDGKLREIYGLACWMLKSVFGMSKM